MRHPNDPIYMLAADHRWQWEQWCDAHGVDRARIPEAKQLALDGLIAARDRSDDARRFATFLVDAEYAAPEVARARAAGIAVGTPVERAGAVPLAWAREPFWQDATGDFVKVLVRHRPEWEADVQARQMAMLQALAAWCRTEGKVFLLEVLVAAEAGEREAEFERLARPGMVAGFIRDAYAAGVVPDFWKIEGTPEPGAMRAVDAAVAEAPGPRILILGKAAPLETIRTWFETARSVPRAAGFAIGRSVYFGPAGDFFSGRIGRDAAVGQIAANYLTVIDAWKGVPHD